MSTVALDLAHDLFWVSTGAVEALEAVSDGKTWYYDEWTTAEKVAAEVLSDVAQQARRVELACGEAHPALARVCEQMADFLGAVKSRRQAREGFALLSLLTTRGRELVAVEEGAFA